MAGHEIYDLKDFVEAYTRKARAIASNIQGAVGEVAQAAASIPPPVLLTPDMSLDQARRVPRAMYSPEKYGDMTSLLMNLGAGLDQLVLNRPVNTRVFLLIFNPTAANIFAAFDQQANAGSLPIPPGGNLFFDNFIPQNDIHLFSIGAAVIPVFYSNIDIVNV